ncbi:MAG TPA: hypothetical protein VG078_11380 [Acidimicrobiales bacterium]|nr:hypothetical protein [Acidimicrobiales bacterium]
MLTSLLVLAALAALVTGLAVPGTSFILMSLSIAFSGGALLTRFVRSQRRDGEPAPFESDVALSESSEGAASDIPEAVVDELPARGGAAATLGALAGRWDQLVVESRQIIENDAGTAHLSGVLTDDLRDTLVRLITAHLRVEVDRMRRDLIEVQQHFTAALMDRVDGLSERRQEASASVDEALATALAELRQDVASGFDRLARLPTLSSAATKVDLDSGLAALREAMASFDASVETSMSALRSGVESLSDELDALRPAVTNADLDVKVSELSARARSLCTRSEVEELVGSSADELRSMVGSLSADFQTLRATVDNERLSASISALDRRLQSLCTRSEVENLVATSTAGVGAIVSSVSEDLRKEVAEVHDEVGRLRNRLSSRRQPVRLDEGEVERVAASVRAAIKGSAVKQTAAATSRAAAQAAKATAKKTAKGTKAAAPKKAAVITKAGRAAKGTKAAAPKKAAVSTKAGRAAKGTKAAAPKKAAVITKAGRAVRAASAAAQSVEVPAPRKPGGRATRPSTANAPRSTRSGGRSVT